VRRGRGGVDRDARAGEGAPAEHLAVAGDADDGGRAVRGGGAVKSNGRLKRTKLACSRRGKALKRSGNKVAASRLAKLCPTRRRRAQR
jgi:hypothetical protein